VLEIKCPAKLRRSAFLADVLSILPMHLIALEETFPLIRNAKGVVAAANNRIPQSFVKGGNHRANRKLSVPRRENLQISYLAPFLPSCHYNQRVMRSLHLKPAALSPHPLVFYLVLYSSLSLSSFLTLSLFLSLPISRLSLRPTMLDTGFRAPNLYAI